MTRVLWLAVLVCVVQCLPMSQDELEDFSNFLLKTSSLDLHVKSADPDGSYDEDEVVSDHAWEESGKFEGDLILNDRQRRLIVENVEGLSRNGLTDSTKRWPNNEVIYFIQKEHFTGGQVQAIQDGIDDLARASCVKFRPYRKGDRDAVVIQGSRRGCFSQVGYQGGFQVLNLSGRHPVGRGCFRHGTVVHELLHSLGFYHMQSSPDRDDYINVIWSNIVQPARHNFRKYNSFSVSDFGVGYDYDSVLHYSRRAFSANGQDTLVPKTSGAEIGQRVGLSDKDTQKLNKMYCDADNDPVQADENTTKKPKNKKKKPKNQPFEGHGIGYHQGKTVVIKLPAAQTYKLPNVPSTHMFDFSKTPEVVPPEAGGYRFGKEVKYTYNPIFSPNAETIVDDSYTVKPQNQNTENQHEETDIKTKPLKEDKDGLSIGQHSNDSNEVKPEYVPIDEYDKDLKEAFHRLTKIVKQHVYPQNQGYIHKINKDYSKFYTPRQTKQSENFQDSSDEKLVQPISYDQRPMFQKQDDKTPSKPTLNENSDANLANSSLDIIDDTFFGVLLPTKEPYSSNDQTETPHYTTLEYLKNRNDYSKLYSPNTFIGNKHKDESKTEGNKYEHIIKINPYDRVYYTDYVKEDKNDRSSDDPIVKNLRKEFKSNKYKLDEGTTIDRQSDLPNKHLEDRMDASYGLFFPTKKPYSAYEQTETPKYATLEYLKDRHDIDNLYKPKSFDDGKRNEPYVALGDGPPTEGEWFNKDSLKLNPANYDRDSYTDYVQQNGNGNYNKEEKLKDLKIYKSDESDTENSTELADRPKAKYGIVDDDQDTSYERENNGRPFHKQIKGSEEINSHGYYGDYAIDDKDFSAYYDPNEAENNRKNASKNNQLKHEPENYNHDYEKENISGLEEESRENDNEHSQESPKKSQAYNLYGAPVPVTRNWFKPRYTITENINHDDHSRSDEYHNR